MEQFKSFQSLLSKNIDMDTPPPISVLAEVPGFARIILRPN